MIWLILSNRLEYFRESIVMKSLILFGHGARDAKWREPFDRLVQLWTKQHADIPVKVAFLEIMGPSLGDAIEALVNMGSSSIVVVPVFFGQGSHLQRDLPTLLNLCREKYPKTDIRATRAVGEDLVVLQAIIDFGAKFL